MRIGIIGSGVAGLTAAYLLARRNEVTLLEKDAWLGGHARTVDVTTPSGGTVALDTGFIVHNQRTYPNLIRLFDELGVETKDGDMSMSVRCDGCGLEYAGAKGLGGLFPGGRNLARPRFLKMLGEVKRFHSEAHRVLEDPNGSTVTVGEFIEAGAFSRYFQDHFLLPLVGAVWSSSHDLAAEYPARYLFRFLDNHGMLSVKGSPTWRTVVGGSRAYVNRIAENVQHVMTGAEVVSIARDDRGATVTVAPSDEHRFDAVVIATHPDQTLKLLDEPTDDERRLLGAWRYSRNAATLHTDRSMLPRSPHAAASWNYLSERVCDTDGDPVRITYDLTRLMRLDEPEHYLVTLNQTDDIDPATVIEEIVYEHPVYTLESLAAQRELPALQGVSRTWYCGAYHGWGFHEDGCSSGVRVAEALGAGW